MVGAQSAGPNDGGEAYIYSGVDGALIHTLQPSDPSRALVFGQFFASGAGDVDKDGYEDAYVGDYAGLDGAGETYIFSGATGQIIHRIPGVDTDDGFGPVVGLAMSTATATAIYSLAHTPTVMVGLVPAKHIYFPAAAVRCCARLPRPTLATCLASMPSRSAM